jgi:hypothetical protein
MLMPPMQDSILTFILLNTSMITLVTSFMASFCDLYNLHDNAVIAKYTP